MLRLTKILDSFIQLYIISLCNVFYSFRGHGVGLKYFIVFCPFRLYLSLQAVQIYKDTDYTYEQSDGLSCLLF